MFRKDDNRIRCRTDTGEAGPGGRAQYGAFSALPALRFPPHVRQRMSEGGHRCVTRYGTLAPAHWFGRRIASGQPGLRRAVTEPPAEAGYRRKRGFDAQARGRGGGRGIARASGHMSREPCGGPGEHRARRTTSAPERGVARRANTANRRRRVRSAVAGRQSAKKGGREVGSRHDNCGYGRPSGRPCLLSEPLRGSSRARSTLSDGPAAQRYSL